MVYMDPDVGCHKNAVNSLAPGRPGCHFKTAIFNLVLLIGIFTSSKDNTLRWMPRDLTDDKSTLVQVMAWCRQATSHYLSQCWPSSMSPYCVTRPQWVKLNHSLTWVNIDSMSWHVQNFVVIRRIHYEQEHYKFSLNFEFGRHMVSGTGARSWFVALNDHMNQ